MVDFIKPQFFDGEAPQLYRARLIMMIEGSLELRTGRYNITVEISSAASVI